MFEVDIEPVLLRADIADDRGSSGRRERENSFRRNLFRESSDLEVFGAEGGT